MRLDMTDISKYLHDYICDECGKEFLNIENNQCPLENPVMAVFLGFKTDALFMQRRIGYDFGDLCKSCQQKLFSLIKDNYPHLEFVKEND
jgi:hypothetical protein